MDITRRNDLYELWSQETEAPETQEWRDGLSPEELDAVAQWDIGYARGVARVARTILIRELIRDRYSRREIRELETVGDHCRLRLRDGSLYLARLTSDNQLRLDALDDVC